MIFRPLAISLLLLTFLMNRVDASRYGSIRLKRDVCPNPNPNTCSFVNCENGGICQEDRNTLDCFLCVCPAGFTGKTCETTIPILPIGCSPGCQNNGFCNNNVCICPTGYSGTLCEIQDNCLPTNPCQNGGLCTSNSLGFQCDCTGTGFTGTVCTDAIITDPCSPSPCLNGGQCSSNSGTANCLCINGYIGTFCQTLVPCAAAPCQNGGTCELLAGDVYGCKCPPDYTGNQCETPTIVNHPCVTMPAQMCLNGGTCTISGIDYVCKCAPGWDGRNCEIQGMTSTCTPDACGHGTCYIADLPIGPTAFCKCDIGWTGLLCDVDMTASCVAGYCLSGGTCQIVGNVPTCQCPPMYTGLRCEYDMGVTPIPITTTPDPTITPGNLCQTNPCSNGGICYVSGSSFTCTCPPMYTGLLCETFQVTTASPPTTPVPLVCANLPCQNGGTCVAVGASYSCFCGLNSIYTGKNCDSTTPMPASECPLSCAPGRCIFSGFPARPYACLWNGVMRPADGLPG